MEISANCAVAGADFTRSLDALFVNAPLRDYSLRPRINDFTLPVLGMGYIATYAARHGFNVGVIDAEAWGLGVDQTTQLVNELSPRWAGFNLLAPTYEISARIAAGLDPSINVMVGGHQAKAMPTETLTDPRFARLEALVLGEGETRVVELLKDKRYRSALPGVMWLDPIMKTPVTGGSIGAGHHLAPDIDHLPFVDRAFLADDPYRASDGRFEANMVGARGCPYDCSFCGAAVSANPDITIRTRTPENIILGFPTETREELHDTVRLVYDLWDIEEKQPGRFRASVFEFRPYPGTPEWHQLIATGQYEPQQLLDYTAVDLTAGGLDEAMRGRDEFNFSVNVQFGEASADEVRARLTELSREQYQRSRAVAA